MKTMKSFLSQKKRRQITISSTSLEDISKKEKRLCNEPSVRRLRKQVSISNFYDLSEYFLEEIIHHFIISSLGKLSVVNFLSFRLKFSRLVGIRGASFVLCQKRLLYIEKRLKTYGKNSAHNNSYQ